jgi:Tfp pilus tip-associated adhesin PilY1
MQKENKRGIASLLIGMALVLSSSCALAEDIDIFVGASGGSAAAPVVMILLDSTNDWCTDLPNAKSKITALKNVLNSISNPVNVGLAMWSYNSPSGAYVRFAPRDVSVLANRNALLAMLDVIALCPPPSPDKRIVPPPIETGNQKEESAGLFEIWRFYSSLQAKTGLQSQNYYADKAANIDKVYPNATAAGAGMTTGFAFVSDGVTYNGPAASTCGKFYIIYIAANNGSPNDGMGSQTYMGAGTDAGTKYNAGAAVPKAVVNGVVPKTGWADAWARYLNNPPTSTAPRITTYVIDAFYPVDNQDAGYSLFLQSIARQGGGSYYGANDSAGAQIQAALMRIFAEIKSVNSTFASASLPVNATNRAQNENQVFIGMFRPDPDAKPRWFGNMKRYQLILNAGNIDLGDAAAAPAVNPLTGFLANCATSFWSSDSGPYWGSVTTNPPARGNCPASSFDPFSDAPDGPFVEKGGVAEVLRKGNNPPGTDTSPTNAIVRNLYTLSTATPPIVDFFDTASALGGPLVNFTTGQDVNAEVTTRIAPSTLTRPSLHGDVIHSRPLPLNYGGTIGTVVYYGANDGTLRAAEATSGKVKWAFIAREHYASLQRLMDQSPLVSYPNQANTSATVVITIASPGLVTWTGHTLANGDTVKFATTGALPGGLATNTRYYVVNAALNTFQLSATSGGVAINTSGTQSGTQTGITPGNIAKNYFFDGSIGAFHNLDNSKVWIYPSMRRGGRLIYALNVSAPADTYPTAPSFMWKAGCPNLTNDTGCTTGLSGIGQTWSLPAVAFIKGYSTTEPVVMFGGGYDGCEDANSSAPSCTGEKGAGVYIVDALKGPGSGVYSAAANNLLQSFTTDRAVAADPALVDVDGDGRVDYAYVVDTGGSIYRISFVDAKTQPLTPDKWTITKIAYTTGAGRKFLFPPALLFNGGKIYVAVGSGDREHPLSTHYPYGDGKTTNIVNRFYVYVDDTTSATATNLDDTTVMLDKTTDLGCDIKNELVTPSSTKKGWFMPLTANGVGEQTVTSAVIAAGLVTFSTNRPIPPAAGSCGTQLGEARGYFLSLLNGAGAIGVTLSCGGIRSGTFAGGGLPPSPVTGVIPVGGVNRTIVIGAIQRSGAGSSPIASQQLRPPITQTRKRIYWYTPGSDN